MEQEKSVFDHLADDLKEYINTKQELLKLTIAEKSGKVVSGVVLLIAIMAIIFLVILFASVALAVCLSKYLGNPYSGFLIVSGLYFILMFIIILAKDRWIRQPVTNSIIKIFFNDDDYEKN